MRINGVDIRTYGAKQLTVKTAPPKMTANYEMLTKALLPTEYDSDIPLGTMTVTIYFREKDRAALERTMSSFMRQFRSSCVLDEIKGFKGKYKAFLTNEEYQDTLVKEKKILSLEFAGYFFDDEIRSVYNGKTSGKLRADGSRDMPCSIEVTAREELENFEVKLNDESYTIASLGLGERIRIDGTKGKVTKAGKNAFDSVELWSFPKLSPGENELEFSNEKATVEVSYTPIWL